MQDSLPLPQPPADAPPELANYLVLGIDPGMAAGWALVTAGARPARVASGHLANCERDPKLILARTVALLDAAGTYTLAAAIEDMPAAFLKSRGAGERLVEARLRWRDALEATGRLVAPVYPLHLQVWRRISGVQDVARALPRISKRMGAEEVLTLDWKGAARRWCSNVLGHETRNDNEAEALGVAYAFARMLHAGEVTLDGRAQRRRAPTRQAPRTKRSRAPRPR